MEMCEFYLLFLNVICVETLQSTGYEDVPSVKVAQTFYNTCTIASSMGRPLIKKKIGELIKLLFNGWLMSSNDAEQIDVKQNVLSSEKFNVTALLSPSLFQIGETALFSLKLVKDITQNGVQFIEIHSGSLDAFDKEKLNVSSQEDSEVKELIFKYLENVGALQTNENMMDGVFELYSELKNAQKTIVDSGPSRITHDLLTTNCPIIDWDVLFRNVFENESYNQLEFTIQSEEAWLSTCDILRSKVTIDEGRKNIHNMVVIDFLYKMRNYLQQYFEDFYPTNNDKKPPTCFEETKENFWWTINKEHKYSSISKTTKDEVNQMFNEMKHKLTELLSQRSWSSEDDKQKAILTVSNISVLMIDSAFLDQVIKERDIILENELSENNYFINAYYSQKARTKTSLFGISRTQSFDHLQLIYPVIAVQSRKIVILSGILHSPFWSESHSMSEKYGIFGWLLGSQIISAVLNGEELQSQTEYPPQCQPTASTPFGSQLCCLSEQINSEIPQNEIVEQLSAGISGLMLSFEAYKKRLTGNLDSLNEKKMFFSAFAKIVCSGLSLYTIQSGSRKHIEAYGFIVNDVLKHSQGFSEAYQCKIGSIMNPVRKCIL
ncbi:family M13 unassigned peptidase (M13 family) [Schistosoma mansoni]|uniref:family M13 unassigned peptidase (M13 family) n=1 Tax=Schistosoma mansoni TaxID=6183 RepID=UPI00022DC348|nr:family M13 unassigned peptidase (M13 family) [Schistosoma mansoni]|eukprot:XP_018650567.1 family M13 unassigned peptidase (M13 family) [Schistosoma mansoni]